MISKTDIKKIRLLHQKKYRDETKTFIAEGPKTVIDFIKSGMEPLALYGLPGFFERNEKIFSALSREKKISVSETGLKKISSLSAPSQVLGIFPVPEQDSYRKYISKVPFLVLENISDPGNMGTIIRIAGWFGFAVMASPGSVDFYNPKVVQASMGSAGRVKLFSAGLEDALLEFKKKIPVFAATLDGKNIYREKLPPLCAVVIGNESRGVSGKILKHIPEKIHIPSFSMGVDSLNAAVCAGIICSEIRRKKFTGQ